MIEGGDDRQRKQRFRLTEILTLPGCELDCNQPATLIVARGAGLWTFLCAAHLSDWYQDDWCGPVYELRPVDHIVSTIVMAPTATPEEVTA